MHPGRILIKRILIKVHFEAPRIERSVVESSLIEISLHIFSQNRVTTSSNDYEIAGPIL